MLDAAGTGVVPLGGVETGAGGTADQGSLGVAALGAGAVVAGAGALLLRGASRPAPPRRAPR